MCSRACTRLRWWYSTHFPSSFSERKGRSSTPPSSTQKSRSDSCVASPRVLEPVSRMPRTWGSALRS
ncbi:MAG: hypothetical protein C4333_01795 [Meiothermus sp.]